MSANLLDGITPILFNGTTESDGIYHHVARTDTSGHDDWLRYIFPEQSALSANQTFHVGLSTRGASANSASLRAIIGYMDAERNQNWAVSDPLPIDTSWGHAEGTIVVPSGMTPFMFYVAAYGTCPETWMASPTLCYGSTGIVMASGSVTVASITDVASTTRYYLLQSSTLTAPDRPTANPPGGSWATTEPTYTEGSTNSLYFVDETVFSDGTWAYSSVSLSTSYEAAKAAYNKAAAAAAAAAATAQHFWADTDGAHVSSTGDHDTSGFHQLMSSVKNAFMHGSTELMTISESLIELGKNSSTAVIKFCNGLAQIAAKTWTWSGTTRTGIDMHATYGTSISADTSVSLDASVEATQLASDGSPGGAINLNGKWLDLYSTDMFSSYQIKMDDVANALDAYFTVRRSANILTAYNSETAHYTKIGIWSGASYANILRLRVMTGNGYNGNATQNSWIDIIVKGAWQPNGTTKAFGVSYELHNASSAVLAPYVVATASDSCDIWIKNSWYDESGWYVAEYNGGTWSDGGSVHQTSVPSGTLQSASCITAIQPVVVLYNGGAALDYDTAPGSGTTGTVTLSETAANFSKLKIFFRTDDNAYGSYEVPFPNGKRAGLSSNWSTGTSMWYKARAIDISGTSITTVGYGNVNSDGSSFSHTNVIYIVRIEGIR